MKYSTVARALFVAVALFPLGAAEFSVSALASNFAFDDDGKIQPDSPGYGTKFSYRDQLMSNLDGIVSFESDPVNGNLLSARASWAASILEISAGPSFGVLNSSSDSDGVPVLFQPGLGIGFSVILPGILTAEADTDFALPPASGTAGQVYLQKSRLAAGLFFPNVLCTLAVSQRSNSLYSPTVPLLKSTTDYGLYTEAFRKGAPWRISIDFVYRVMDYFKAEDSDANRKIANLVLGGGLTWSPKNDFNVFVTGNGSLYSFSLNDATVNDLDKFLFDVKAGVMIRTEKLQAPR